GIDFTHRQIENSTGRSFYRFIVYSCRTFVWDDDGMYSGTFRSAREGTEIPYIAYPVKQKKKRFLPPLKNSLDRFLQGHKFNRGDKSDHPLVVAFMQAV